ncbi:hypothetical protein KSF78_0008835 [Schistosoma japonicum]|nr:hypothetical protein KSF78_0008835 [Schistosoma japonicum]
MYGLLIDEYSAHQQIGMNKDSTSINTMPEILILDTFPFSSSQFIGQNSTTLYQYNVDLCDQ